METKLGLYEVATILVSYSDLGRELGVYGPRFKEKAAAT
jgi:hypothetical protein